MRYNKADSVRLCAELAFFAVIYISKSIKTED